jgi:methionyl-tRNA formyltransferase
VNHVKVYSFIKQKGYKIGVLAGVGIVHREIIESFSEHCLNAHPAPLPECRGGGAVQQTLYKGLLPSASVHFATPEIDAGGILDVEPLSLKPDDTLESVSIRLTFLCAERLAFVTQKLISGGQFEVTENNGQIRYWKDCTKEVQITARRNLKMILPKNQQVG